MSSRIILSTGLALLVYGLFTSIQIQTYPAVWVDEGWIAEPGYALAQGEPLGSPSHGELYRYHDRLYWMGLAEFVALGGIYRTGVDPLAAGRWFSLMVGALGLVALLSLARALLQGAPERRIAWALVFLVLAYTLDPLLWKSHRTLRFEALTSALTLVSVAVVWTRASVLRALLAGMASALAIWTHPNGVFAAVVVVGILVWRRDSWRGFGQALAAFATAGLVTSLPNLVYLFGDAPQDFANVLGQNAPHLHGRSAPVIVQWLREPARYLAAYPFPYLLLPLAALGVAWAFGWLRKAPGGLRWAALVLVLGLASLPNKTELYMAQLTPFLLLGAAWAGVHLRRGWVAALVGVVWLANYAAADAGLLYRNRNCDYHAWSGALARAVPENASVAGTFVVWFPLRDHPFHEFHRQRAGDLADRRPDYVIFGDAHSRDPLFARLQDELVPFLVAEAETVAVAASACYGDAVVYRVDWDRLPPAAAAWERYGEPAAVPSH